MSKETVIAFNPLGTDAPGLDPWPAFGDLPNTRITDGTPTQSGHIAFKDPAGKFQCGIWSATPGAVHTVFPVDEFAYILEGKLRIVPDEGEAVVVGAGEVLISPAGWRGTWEILEPTRKVFSLFERDKG